MDQNTGEIHVYARRRVVEQVSDSKLEISLEEARAIDPNYEADFVEEEVTPTILAELLPRQLNKWSFKEFMSRTFDSVQ